MKFPGRRNKKHYFPVNEKSRLDHKVTKKIDDIYIVGIDQLLVDIEIEIDDSFLEKYSFPKGQSFIIQDDIADEIYLFAKEHNKIRGEFPGGAIGNTLHNFAILSDAHCYALGSIKKQINVGDYAFKYLSKTSGLVDMSYLQSSDKPMGRALCFITPDHERTFAISKGCMNDLHEDSIPANIINKSAALLVSAYTLRNEEDPIFKATIKACEIAHAANVPIVLSLGTSHLIEQKRDFVKSFCHKYVSVLAMNQNEATAYSDIEDPMLAMNEIMNDVDLVMVTVGEKGLYLGGFCDEENLRKTKDPLVTKSIVNYNENEYSRPMRIKDCKNPVRIYTHVNPYQGGPKIIKNTNGAGDAALSALLHDISANAFHRKLIPNSPKHSDQYLCYSSISQISKYANRVSYEVLIQSSPRLFKGLPEKEATLDDAYWSK
jgi:inosine kinase